MPREPDQRRRIIDRPPRIALLIGADNAPAAKIGLVLDELSDVCVRDIRRARAGAKS